MRVQRCGCRKLRDWNNKMAETQTTKKSRTQKQTGKAKKVLGLILLITVLGIAAVYIAFSLYYRTHFLPNTTINGIEAGGQNAAAVEDEIRDQVHAYTLSIQTNSGEIETISGEEISISPDFHGELDELLAAQNSFTWPAALFKGNALTVGTMVSYDNVALEDAIHALDCMQPENMLPPQDARLSDYTEEGFVVLPEDYGSTIDTAAMEQAVTDAVSTMTPMLDLTKADCYILPQVTAEDDKLVTLASKLNNYAMHTITLDMGADTRTITGETIAGWLSADENNDIQVDKQAIARYVEDLAKETDTYGVPKDFSTSYDQDITFQSVYYGWKIDQAAETEQLLSDVQAGRDITREPMYEYRGASRGDKDYGDTYVEVNLSAQHMFCYKDGVLALDAPCVTGCVGKGTITHVGVYPIYSKETDRDLVGENYRSHVNYWMPFDAGEGLHDATWRSSFGGSIYLTNGSHGCVNLSNSVAGQLYDLVEVGTPVFVYRMDSTATASEAQMASMAVSAINSVGGMVSLASEPALVRARNIYNYLSPENRGLVTNYDQLVNYEAQLASLKSQLSAAQAAALAQIPVIGNE